jgi:hypothetical protein
LHARIDEQAIDLVGQARRVQSLGSGRSIHHPHD